jgi:hypothetical protein
MTTTFPLRVEVSVPRAVYDTWAGQAGAETMLRTSGVLPPTAQEVRWRMDVVNAGYVVTYTVPITLPQQGGP